MQKRLSVLGFAIALLAMPGFVLAATMTGLKATPNEPYLNFSWDAASTEDQNQADGYALQWSEKQTDMQNNKQARQFIDFGKTTFSVRLNSFDRNRRYYFRIYTYELDGRDKVLTNGSKILKWEMSANYTVTSEEIEANDPVIVDNSSDDDSSSSSVFDFGETRVLPLDNFADFSWSRPAKMVKSDYDGFYITIAKANDMSDVVKSFKTDRNKNSARVKGLDPSTQYYVRGSFYKMNNGKTKTFGHGTIKAFKTIDAIDRSVSTRVTRNLAKIEKKAYYTVQVGVEDSTSSSTSTTTTTTSSTSSSSSTTTSSSSSSSVQKRITEIKAEIKRLQAELDRLEGGKTTTTTTTTSTKKKSIREILREKLAARRNK